MTKYLNFSNICYVIAALIVIILTWSLRKHFKQKTNYIQKLDKYFALVLGAMLELHWVYLPLIVLVLVLTVLGKIEEIPYLPDMLVVCAVLFGESMTKVKNIAGISRNERESIYLFGLYGFVFSLVLLTLAYFSEHSNICDRSESFKSFSYFIIQCFLWSYSSIYSIYVRVKIALSNTQARVCNEPP